MNLTQDSPCNSLRSYTGFNPFPNLRFKPKSNLQSNRGLLDFTQSNLRSNRDPPDLAQNQLRISAPNRGLAQDPHSNQFGTQQDSTLDPTWKLTPRSNPRFSSDPILKVVINHAAYHETRNRPCLGSSERGSQTKS